MIVMGLRWRVSYAGHRVNLITIIKGRMLMSLKNIIPACVICALVTVSCGSSSGSSSSILALAGGGYSINNLTASDAAGGDYFGTSVSLSDDGTLLAVGANRDDSNTGAVYVFTKSGDTWTEAAKLTASDAATGQYLGFSVSVSGDGSTIVTQASGVGSRGLLYVFVRPGGGWNSMTQTARLTASDGVANDNLGVSVSVSSDGSVVAAGAFLATVAGKANTGAVYVFTRPVGGWVDGTQTAKLVCSANYTNDYVGRSVAVSADGLTVAAGVPNYDGEAANSGAVLIFERPGGAWADCTQTAVLSASVSNNYDMMGNSLSISSDGGTVVVDASYAEVGSNTNQGAAYVFVRPATGWANAYETARLTSSDGAAMDYFGTSVAISRDGSRIAVGAPPATVGGNAGEGALYIYKRPSSGWKTTSSAAKPKFKDGAAGDAIGSSIALSSNGSVIAVGANTDNSAAGSVYVLQ